MDAVKCAVLLTNIIRLCKLSEVLNYRKVNKIVAGIAMIIF